MSHPFNGEALLAYCILRGAGLRTPDSLPSGVDGKPVAIVARNGLGVVTSRVAVARVNGGVAPIMTFQNVVESFHRGQTVIPIRYPSCFSEEPRLLRFLDERANQFEALLSGLDGCSEMGIRALISASTECRRPGFTTATGPGRAYLAERRAEWLQEEVLLIEQQAVIKKICGALDGLFLQSRTEHRLRHEAHFVSVYFLVPNQCLQSFARVFEETISTWDAKVLLTGPWAPYNFVEPEVDPSGYDA